MANPAPVIGEWYRRVGGDSFEVVAIDPDDRTIEIQYFDGTIEELELDEWLEDVIQSTEPPEDWTGSVDVEPEDTENEYEAAVGRPAAVRGSRRGGWLLGTRVVRSAGRPGPVLIQPPRPGGSSSGTASSSST